MRLLESSMTSKGQVTIPQSIRAKLGLKPGQKVRFELAGDHATIQAARTSIEDFYQMAPPLNPPRTLGEIAEIVAEEIAQQAMLDDGD